mgnify:CR=1 FL=1
MKYFAEIIKTDESETPNDFKVEVKDKQEALKKIQQKEVDFVGKSYLKRFHICFHKEEFGEKENLPCQAEIL